MIKVIAIDFIKEEFIEKVIPLYKELVKETKKEKKCVEYNLFIEQDVQGHFIFIEEWPDMEALNEHCETEHFRRIIPAIKKFQSKNSTVTIMDSFESVF